MTEIDQTPKVQPWFTLAMARQADKHAARHLREVRLGTMPGHDSHTCVMCEDIVILRQERIGITIGC